MEMVLWSYDLVLAFQDLCLPEEVRNWNIATLRREIWWLPAEWVQTGQSQRFGAPSQVSTPRPVPQIQQATDIVRPLV
jgi:hypothetical protein